MMCGCSSNPAQYESSWHYVYVFGQWCEAASCRIDWTPEIRCQHNPQMLIIAVVNFTGSLFSKHRHSQSISITSAKNKQCLKTLKINLCTWFKYSPPQILHLVKGTHKNASACQNAGVLQQHDSRSGPDTVGLWLVADSRPRGWRRPVCDWSGEMPNDGHRAPILHSCLWRTCC